jgi:hypothetical protein
MVNQTLAAIIAVAFIALQGCATTHDVATHTYLETTAAIPTANPALDHYIAWVPLEKAQTATVAKALTHISLGNAREQTAAELCGDSSVINSKVTGSVGPVRTLTPLAAGGYPAWYYRISQHPGLHGCTGTDSHRFYQALQANLPAWINIRAAENRVSTALDLPE